MMIQSYECYPALFYLCSVFAPGIYFWGTVIVFAIATRIVFGKRFQQR